MGGLRTVAPGKHLVRYRVDSPIARRTALLLVDAQIQSASDHGFPVTRCICTPAAGARTEITVALRVLTQAVVTDAGRLRLLRGPLGGAYTFWHEPPDIQA